MSLSSIDLKTRIYSNFVNCGVKIPRLLGVDMARMAVCLLLTSEQTEHRTKGVFMEVQRVTEQTYNTWYNSDIKIT